MRSNRFLTKITSLQPKLKNAAVRCGPQDQGKLTRLSWNAPKFDEDRDIQVADFIKKLTHCQLNTNFIKRSNS
jgi:hypothetical protein